MNSDRKKETGILGEHIAAAYLEKKGYDILDRNFKVKMGEIDIIAQKDSVAVFVEVKTRTTDDFGLPEESISSQKINRIRGAAGIFLSERNMTGNKDIRFDILSIKIDRDHQETPERSGDFPGSPYRINHIKDAF